MLWAGGPTRDLLGFLQAQIILWSRKIKCFWQNCSQQWSLFLILGAEQWNIIFWDNSMSTIHFAFVQRGKRNISLKSLVSIPSSFPGGCSKLTKLCFKCCLSTCFQPINNILKMYISSYIYEAPPTQLFGWVQNSMSNKYHKGSPQTNQNSFTLLIHFPSFTNFYF